MLEHSHGLNTATLGAIADLQRRVLAVDGGRLKLEWNTLRSRPSDQVNDLLWWDGSQLLGFCGIYLFGGSVPEIAGMVDPTARRHGIATALLDAALRICAERGSASALVVTPRRPDAGGEFARSRGGRLEHSEHAMLLAGPPAEGPSDDRITLRAASIADADVIAAVLTASFAWVPDDLAGDLAREDARNRSLVVEVDGEPVGTLRLAHECSAGTDTGSIYGFAVLPARRGRGIGRNVLRRACRILRDEGATRITLEVAVDNEHALGLYTSTGFEPVTTEDYYALPISPPAAAPAGGAAA